MMVWVGKLVLGLRNHGLTLFGMFIPGGAPFAMVPFFVFVELIGFLIPMVSLAVRLFANLCAGHILLKVLFGFCWTMMMSGGVLFVAHFVPLLVLFLLLGLETAVALIQAYVFTLLTVLYIGDCEKGGH
jgi:ATP synthase subunit 6